MKKFFLFLFVYGLCFMVISPQLSTVNCQLLTLNLKETKLATIPEDYQKVSKIIFSANGKQVVTYQPGGAF